jgi:hypothetical protein
MDMPASVFDPQRVIFAAMSKRSFYLREHIVKFILEQHFTPMCAFMMYSYFLLDTVNRVSLIQANNELIRRSDELWVFGPISDGVKAEIDFARTLKQPTKFFVSNSDRTGFVEIDETLAEWE